MKTSMTYPALVAVVLICGCKPQNLTDIFPKNANDLQRTDFIRETDFNLMAGLVGRSIYNKAASYNLEAVGRAIYSAVRVDREGEKISAGQAVVVEALQMDTPLDAFGLFSQLRKGKTQADIGASAIVDGGTIVFWKGRFVVEVRPEERVASTLPAAGAKKNKSMPTADEVASVAKLIADKIRNDKPKLEYFNWLPKENQISGSLQYVRQNFLDRPEMEQVMVADYSTKDSRYQCFIFGFVSNLSAAKVFDSLSTGMTRGNTGSDALESLQFTDSKNGEVTVVLAGRMIVGTTQGQKATALAIGNGFARKFRRQELEQDYYDTYIDAYPYTYYPFSTYYSGVYFYSGPGWYGYPYYYRNHCRPYYYPYRCGPVYRGGGGRCHR